MMRCSFRIKLYCRERLRIITIITVLKIEHLNISKPLQYQQHATAVLTLPPKKRREGQREEKKEKRRKRIIGKVGS